MNATTKTMTHQSGGPTSAWGWGGAPERAWGWGGCFDTEITI